MNKILKKEKTEEEKSDDGNIKPSKEEEAGNNLPSKDRRVKP